MRFVTPAAEVFETPMDQIAIPPPSPPPPPPPVVTPTSRTMSAPRARARSPAREQQWTPGGMRVPDGKPSQEVNAVGYHARVAEHSELLGTAARGDGRSEVDERGARVKAMVTGATAEKPAAEAHAKRETGTVVCRYFGSEQACRLGKGADGPRTPGAGFAVQSSIAERIAR